MENTCTPFDDADALAAAGYAASSQSTATSVQDFGVLSCFGLTHAQDVTGVPPSATCPTQGGLFAMSGCSKNCTAFDSDDAINALGYEASTSSINTTITAGNLGNISCHAATHVRTETETPPTAACTVGGGPFVLAGCSARAACSTIACPDNYHRDSSRASELCAGLACDATLDRDTCCASNECRAGSGDPSPMYSAANANGTTVPALGAVTCTTGHMSTAGTAPAAACPGDSGDFEFSGCEARSASLNHRTIENACDLCLCFGWRNAAPSLISRCDASQHLHREQRLASCIGLHRHRRHRHGGARQPDRSGAGCGWLREGLEDHHHALGHMREAGGERSGGELWPGRLRGESVHSPGADDGQQRRRGLHCWVAA